MGVTSLVMNDSNALTQLQRHLVNSRRPDMIALAEKIGDGTLTTDEFVSATQTVLPQYLVVRSTLPQTAGAYFAQAITDYAGTGDTAEAILIDPKEVVDVWQSFDKLGAPEDNLGSVEWTNVTVPGTPLTVPGTPESIGTIEVWRRAVPKGWRLKTEKLDTDHDWRPVHYLDAEIVIKKDKFPIPMADFADLIYSLQIYDIAIRAVSASRVQGDPAAHLFYNKIILVPGIFGCGSSSLDGVNVIKMDPYRSSMTKDGHAVIKMNWTSMGPKGLNYNSMAGAEANLVKHVDTWGTWELTDTNPNDPNAGEIHISYIAVVDVLNFPGPVSVNMGTAYTPSTTSGGWSALVNGGANLLIDKGTGELVADMLNLGGALLVARGNTTTPISQIKPTLIEKYDKCTGQVKQE